MCTPPPSECSALRYGPLETLLKLCLKFCCEVQCFSTLLGNEFSIHSLSLGIGEVIWSFASVTSSEKSGKCMT